MPTYSSIHCTRGSTGAGLIEISGYRGYSAVDNWLIDWGSVGVELNHAGADGVYWVICWFNYNAGTQ